MTPTLEAIPARPSTVESELVGLKVLLAHECPETRRTLEGAVSELRHEIVKVCETGTQMIQFAHQNRPDLIVTGVDLPEIDGISALVELSREIAIPAIVVTPRRSLDLVEQALRDHVMAYLVEPIEKEEIKPTIYLVIKRFEQFQELREEVKTLKQALDDRKVIERAKGVLMRRGDVCEEEAYRRLRRYATDSRIRLIEAARKVLTVESKSGAL